MTLKDRGVAQRNDGQRRTGDEEGDGQKEALEYLFDKDSPQLCMAVILCFHTASIIKRSVNHSFLSWGRRTRGHSCIPHTSSAFFTHLLSKAVRCINYQTLSTSKTQIGMQKAYS